MNPTEYLSASERTERKFPEGMTISHDVRFIMRNLASDANMICEALDHMKRHLIYGAPLELEAPKSEFYNANRQEVQLSQAEAELLHAAVGKMTEAEELFSAMIKMIDGDEVDLTNAHEEIGDGLWYDAIILRHLGKSFEDCMRVNIEKLQARFPDKFTSEDALNRDLDTERRILEEGRA